MTTEMLFLLIAVCFWMLARLESREAREETMVRDLVRDARRSKPRMQRNPARFGTVGYRTGR